MHWSTLSALLLLLKAGAAQYDYVISGAGTSGLLLAVALSNNPNVTVAVLEAGGDGRTDVRITNPDQEGAIQNTIYDWNFTSVAQKGLVNSATSPVNRGKVLGGSSAMHWMIWNAASKDEFDGWQSVHQNAGWNWTSINSAMKTAEHFVKPVNVSSIETYNLSYHGVSGPIYTTMSKSLFSLYADYYIPTLRRLNVLIPVDKNGGISTGAHPAPLSLTASPYARSYSGSAFTAVQMRPNLHVFPNSRVGKIVWGPNASTGKAVATDVQYYNSSNANARANILAKRVILSAGAAQTPQLLELSGIGDPKILGPLLVPVKVNLTAVGTKVQDHITTSGSFGFSVNNFTGFGGAQNMLDYAPASRFLTGAELTTLRGWLASKNATSTSAPAVALLKYLLDKDQPIIEYGWFGPFVNCYLLHPVSQGSVHINSADPLAKPVIDLGLNAALINGTAVDLWILTRAVRWLTDTLSTTSPFLDIQASFSISGSSGSAATQAAVKSHLGTGQHISGGAVMLPQASGGVVDTGFKVYGTDNVFVVDGSVFPTAVGSHPQSLNYALAMRAADILSKSFT